MPLQFWLLSFITTLIVTIYYFIQPSAITERFFLHLSFTRLIGVCILIVIAVLFAIIFWRSRNNKSHINNFLKNRLQKTAFRIFALSVLDTFFVLLLFFLTRKPSFYGDKRLLFEKFQIFIIWALLLLFLAGIFVEFFQKDCLRLLQLMKTRTLRYELAGILGLFCLVVIVKLSLVTNNVFGPIVTGDEITYFRMANDIFEQKFTAEYNHYPFLYPLVLSLSFFEGNKSYEWIKILNVLLSSSIVFPIYLISKQYLNNWQSLLVSLLSVLTPFHIVFPRQIMSENLYFPLLLWSIFFIIKKPDKNRNLANDLFTGVLLGAMYLTRYISLAIIPFLLAAWWFKPFNQEDKLLHPSKRKLLHFGGLLTVMFLTFSLWLIYGIRDQIPLRLMFGFGQYGKSTPGQITIANFIKWIFLYGCYVVLIAAPVLNLLFIGIRQLNFKNIRTGYQHLVITFLAAMCGIFVAVVRHSWRAAYNNEIPAKIMGRYLVYFSAFFFILAIINLIHFDRHKYKNIWYFLFENLFTPVVFVGLAYLTIIKQLIIPLGSGFIRFQGSVDVFFIQVISNAFLPIIISIYTITNLLLWYKGKYEALLFVGIGLTGYFLLGSPSYYKELHEEQIYPQLGVEILNVVAQDSGRSDGLPEFVVIMSDKTDNSFIRKIEYGLEVHGIGNPLVLLDKPGMISPIENEGFSSILYNKNAPPFILDNRYILYVDENKDLHPNSDRDYSIKVQNKDFYISAQP